jgi:hypothetical protein
MSTLTEELYKDRVGSYLRLRGGFPVLLAGATYWAALAAAGYLVEPRWWHMIALFGSGAIFPLALIYAAIFRNNFMKDRTAVSSVIGPAFIGMLLFWPIAIAAFWEAPGVFPLVLAVGLSMHFPVIGWSYGRTALYSAHAIIRAVIVFMIWWKLPEARLTLLPASVSAIYLITVLAVIADSAAAGRKLQTA